jgi:hypothetical protein
VGINTTAPAAKVHIKGSSDIPQFIWMQALIKQMTVHCFKLRSSNGTDLLWLHSDKEKNVFMGVHAGESNTTGDQNTF